ncbi:MAG: serine hydrolase [Blautia sp.]|nr:serine hydrolase [Blautia sp.]
MKCTDRKKIRTILCLLCTCTLLLAGCGSLPYDLAYAEGSRISSFNVVSGQDRNVAEPFAAGLCVVTEDVTDDENVDLSQVGAAILFGLSGQDILYSRNAHEILPPASLTKVMTALVALQHGSLDQRLTATNTVNITEAGAQLCGLKSGDSMTLDQALRILLVYSANDVAMLIAENIGGTVDNFVEMMNQEARRLGATNTHFANPNGLTDQEHYTTAYDLYLIFNEAVRYDTFNEIIQMTSYQTTYLDKNGKEKTFDKTTTNLYIRGDYQPPSNVNVIGGKTGTTQAAGHCLMLLVRDSGGAPYIAIILGSAGTDSLYREMTNLLDEINK